MAHRLRLLKTGAHDACFNMGLDEAVLEAVSAGKSEPTLRLYAWTPAAVSIGYFQGLKEEVDEAACAERGVDVVRRITGGGAVFHQKEITYSIVLPEGHALAPASILKSYELICGGVIAGLGHLDVPSTFAPINDIVSGGKKVSGNAQTRKHHCLLQHGTVLLDVDVDLMFTILKVPVEKAKGKLIEEVKARVSGLRGLLGREVPYTDAEEAMIVGFAEALGLELVPDEPTKAELARAAELAGSRFGSAEWTGKR